MFVKMEYIVASPVSLDAVTTLDRLIFPVEEVWDSLLWKEMLKTNISRVLIAKSDGAIKGFISFYNNGKITKLGVDPKVRNLGVGSTLLALAIECLDKGDFSAKCRNGSSLHVKATNKIAIKLYLKVGFVEDSNVKDYYGQGSDAIRMLRVRS